MFRDAVAQPDQVDPRQQALAGSEQGGRDGEVDLVHEPRLQVLPDGCDTTAEPHIVILGRFAGACERFADAPSDEMKRRAAVHRERGSRMMREHEDGLVVRRVVSPPPLPPFIRPRATNRPEHVPSEYPGADARKSACGEVVVDPRAPPSSAVDLLKRARGEEPVVERHAADAKRVLEILVRSRAEAVERNTETADAELSHHEPHLPPLRPRCNVITPNFIGPLGELRGPACKRGRRSEKNVWYHYARTSKV
jgi:hypothetical protein